VVIVESNHWLFQKSSLFRRKQAIRMKKDTIGLSKGLSQRITFLEGQLSQAPLPSITSKRRQLCSIEEAWNLPISLEMNSRQQQTAQMLPRQITKQSPIQVGLKLHQVSLTRLRSSIKCIFRGHLHPIRTANSAKVPYLRNVLRMMEQASQN